MPPLGTDGGHPAIADAWSKSICTVTSSTTTRQSRLMNVVLVVVDDIMRGLSVVCCVGSLFILRVLT
jgi:hypothetical protein